MNHKYLRTCLLLVVALLTITVFSTAVFAALPEGVPSSLEAPSIQKIELKTHEDGRPYFEAQVYFPQSVLDLDSEAPGGGSVFWDYSVKVDGGSWSEFSGGGYINVYTGGEDGEAPVSAGTFAFDFEPMDEGSLTSVDIKNHIYSYQLRVYYDYYEGWPDVEPIYSPVSNTVTIGSGSFYSNASTWAEPELKKANELGLIPEILKDTDMTKPITREEFAEAAVKFYENVTGTAAQPADKTFKDTTNPEILKAFGLNITAGVGDGTKFEPKSFLMRQQMAAMITRTLKACLPNIVFDITGQPDFKDQSKFASYAIQPAKFIAKHAITVGDGKGSFDPIGNCTREQALMFLVRAYNFLPKATTSGYDIPTQGSALTGSTASSTVAEDITHASSPATSLTKLPQGVPEHLDAPSLEKTELIYLEKPRETEKLAAFKLQVKLPQTALDLDAKRPTGGITIIEYFAKADDGKWVTLEGGGYMDDLIGEPSFKVPGKSNTFYVTTYAGEYGDLTAIDLNNHKYSFKVQLHYIYYYGDPNNRDSGYVYSDFSNIVTIGK